MTDSIEAFLNSDVGKKAVEAMNQRSIQARYARNEELLAIALSSLAEQGAMRKAYCYAYGGGREWIADTMHQGSTEYPAFILRRE